MVRPLLDEEFSLPIILLLRNEVLLSFLSLLLLLYVFFIYIYKLIALHFIVRILSFLFVFLVVVVRMWQQFVGVLRLSPICSSVRLSVFATFWLLSVALHFVGIFSECVCVCLCNKRDPTFKLNEFLLINHKATAAAATATSATTVDALQWLMWMMMLDIFIRDLWCVMGFCSDIMWVRACVEHCLKFYSISHLQIV